MFLYRMNKTMEMLGYQPSLQLVCGNGIAAEDFRNVLDAYEKSRVYSPVEIGIDSFTLGYIYGKRAERNKKRQSP